MNDSAHRLAQRTAEDDGRGAQSGGLALVESIAYHLPARTETLADLKRANPDWDIDKIFSKTGVVRRHVSAPAETPLEMAVIAADRLLGGIERASVGALVYVTQSPDSLIPTTACILHRRLGLPGHCLAFDLNQGCSGFVYGLAMAVGLLDAGMAESCLLVCSDAYTRHVSVHDRTSRPIFSDGASAALLRRDDIGAVGPFVFYTDGSGAKDLCLVDVPAADVAGQTLYMNGGKLLRFTTARVPELIKELLDRAGVGEADIDLFVFHQASRVVLDKIQQTLGIGDERVFRNHEDVGNTVSSTIPIALCQARAQGRIGPGMRIVLIGFGVGYSVAGCLLRT